MDTWFMFIDRKILDFFIFCVYLIAWNSLLKTDANMMLFCSVISHIHNENAGL